MADLCNAVIVPTPTFRPGLSAWTTKCHVVMDGQSSLLQCCPARAILVQYVRRNVTAGRARSHAVVLMTNCNLAISEAYLFCDHSECVLP